MGITCVLAPSTSSFSIREASFICNNVLVAKIDIRSCGTRAPPVMSWPGKVTTKQRSASYKKSWESMFHLKRFSSFLPRHRPDRNFSGFIEEKFAAIRYLTKMKSRLELSFPRRPLTVGSRDGQRIRSEERRVGKESIA